MTTLTDFLLARIAENEEMWTTARDGGMVIAVNGQSAIPPQSWIERQVAECKAKRRIAEEITDGGRYAPSDEGARILPLLALPYADHPDYRQEWKP